MADFEFSSEVGIGRVARTRLDDSLDPIACQAAVNGASSQIEFCLHMMVLYLVLLFLFKREKARQG